MKMSPERKIWPVVKCTLCEKEYRVAPYRLKKGEGKTCSRKCAGKLSANRRMNAAKE